MKHLIWPAVLSLTVNAALLAADPSPTAPAANGSEAAQERDAEEAWQQVEAAQKQPTTKPTTKEEALSQAQTWLAAQRTVCDAFAKNFPKDSRRWQAKMISLRAGLQEGRIVGKAPAFADERVKLDEIIKAADAPLPVKAEAAFMRALTYAGEFKTKPESYIAFHEAAADFAAKYAAHPLSIQIQELDLRSLVEDPTPQGAELVKKYLTAPDSRVAALAKKIKAKRDLMAELKSKPLELKFTSTSSQDVDLALFRGKVVLLNFWASTSGPSLAEMPNLVATYQKLHPKGFEIIGISLDQDKAKMQEAMKASGMEWAQYFDGGGWKNKISNGFLIDAVPANWLIDKKGQLRVTGLGGPALEAAVQKLLAE